MGGQVHARGLWPMIWHDLYAGPPGEKETP